MLRTYLIQNIPDPHGPEPVPSGPIPSSRPTGYTPAAIELMDFKKGIKREIAAYPPLKDERYFDVFKRIPMLIILLPPLTMYQIHPMEVEIFLLMRFTRYIPSPLGIHLLHGLAIPPDLLLGHNLKILGLPNQFEGMMALSSCLLKSISY